MSASPYQLPVTCFRPLFSWNLPWASTVQIQNLMMSGLSPRRSNSLAREIRPPFFGPLSWQVQRQSGPQAIAAAQTPSVVEASFAVLLPSLVWQKLEFSCESFATDRPVAVRRILTRTKSNANASRKISLRTNEMTRMISSNVPGLGVPGEALGLCCPGCN